VSFVSDRPIVVAFVIVVAAIFLISGLRFIPGNPYVFSAPICGPLTDEHGNPAGDAGPCPSFVPLPMPRDARWEWAPFWVATD
jgi:hypothetical protein